jgi:hypothetical protein
MIRLRKGEMPSILEANHSTWTAEFLAARAAGGDVPEAVRYRYRHPQIKAALHGEAYSKCIYCETKLAVGETDHFVPVTERPELVVCWENLGLACKECNTNKGAYFSLTEPLINPFVDEPSDHLLFFGPLVIAKAGDLKGLRTELKLKLSRTDLVQRRAERVLRLRPLVARWLDQPDGPTKDLLKAALVAECASAAEYAAVVRTYLYQELGWLYSEPEPTGGEPKPHAA